MDDNSLDTYRQILMDGPGGWRTVRELVAVTISGDVVESMAARSSYAHGWDRDRFIATHEMGHVITKFFVAGTPASAAIVERGGIAGGLWTKPDEAEAAFGTCLSDGSKAQAAKEAASPIQLAALDRLPRAIERLFSKTWIRAALHDLSEKLYEEGFVDGRDSYPILADWFPHSPAFRRVQDEYRQPAPAPGVEAGAGGGAGATTGDVRPDRAGAPGHGAGSKEARPAEAGRNEQAREDSAGEVD